MTSTANDTNKLLLVVVAILLPPVAVFLTKGLGFHFILNLILLVVTVWIGAFIHALWCVLKG
jgi:uncharacterized membrane protein YqaE (UPF0057 family)